MENGEHRSDIMVTVDRSIALVFELFQSGLLDPWDVDLTMFIDLFGERIKTAENIDLPKTWTPCSDGLEHSPCSDIFFD